MPLAFPLQFRFTSTVLAALVSISFGQDHLAHSVPGDNRAVYDLDGDGFESVTLDGSRSHSHYFSQGPPVTNGYVVKWAWRNWGASADKIICDQMNCTLTLSVGKHWIDLDVTDQVGNEATAGMQVTIKSAESAKSAGAPEIFALEPSTGGTDGGTKVTIRGSGFFVGCKVTFGASMANNVQVINSKTITLLTPASEAGDGEVKVETENGSSGPVNFRFTDQKESVTWSESAWKNPNGSEWNLAEEVSGITVGPDGFYYLSTLVGLVWRVDVGSDLVVKSACSGAQMGPGHAIYSIAWNPADPKPRLLVTTNTMWYRDSGSVWHSSHVEFVNIDGDGCVSRGGVIISGLPMSNHDHGVSSMSFLDDGTLLVSVGATTNAGIPGNKMGNTPESPLSGAIVQARYLDKGFNGHIKYSLYEEADINNTEVTSGDVSVYAAGLRSCFGLSMSLNGILYATDNGANSGFGAKSTSCSSEENDPEVKDSLYVINSGNYYGHANRNRGRKDSKQCVWRGEGTTPAIAEMESSTNGVLFYTSDAFGGQLRGNIFLTKMAWMGQPGKTMRVEMSEDGRSIAAGPYEIWGDSGLSIAQGPGGQLFMPQLKKRRVLVLAPNENEMRSSVRASSLAPEVHVVHPSRGNVMGGMEVLISGKRFETGQSVSIGDAPCRTVNVLSSTQIRCKVPSSRRIGAVDVVVSSNGEFSVISGPLFAYAGHMASS